MNGVMLAKSSTTEDPDPKVVLDRLVSQGRWIFDIKWDGVRCVAYIAGGVVRLINRKDVDVTAQYPEVVEYLQQTYPDQQLVLDGEMVCFDPALGKPTFNQIQIRNANWNPRTVAQLAKTMPATYVVFDLLEEYGSDLRKVMLQGRLMLLEKVAERWNDPRLVKSSWDTDGRAMWEQVETLGLEGLIAKQRSSLYRQGKFSTWLKIKPTKRVTAIAYDWEFGKADGARAKTLGALFIGLIEPDQSGLREAGKVGTGFKMKELAPLSERIEAWKRGDGPPLLVEVEYQDLLDSGKLRFPRYLGERHDITWEECTIDQLEGS